jgi:hypothetical protein
MYRQSFTHRGDTAGPLSSRGARQRRDVFLGANTARTFGTLDAPNVNVFYDPATMYKGAQADKVNQILKHGTSHIQQIKRRKLRSDLPVAEQLVQYKSVMQGFYNKPEIETITENQVRMGLSHFDTLIVPEQLKELDSAAERLR